MKGFVYYCSQFLRFIILHIGVNAHRYLVALVPIQILNQNKLKKYIKAVKGLKRHTVAR